MNIKAMLAIAFPFRQSWQGISLSWLLCFTEHASSNLLPLCDRNTLMMEDGFTF